MCFTLIIINGLHEQLAYENEVSKFMNKKFKLLYKVGTFLSLAILLYYSTLHLMNFQGGHHHLLRMLFPMLLHQCHLHWTETPLHHFKFHSLVVKGHVIQENLDHFQLSTD